MTIVTLIGIYNTKRMNTVVIFKDKLISDPFVSGVAVESSGTIRPSSVLIRPRSGRRRSGNPLRDGHRREIRNRRRPEAPQRWRRRYFAQGENRNSELGLEALNSTSQPTTSDHKSFSRGSPSTKFMLLSAKWL